MAVIATLIPAVAIGEEASSTRNPNVLLIMTDDQGYCVPTRRRTPRKEAAGEKGKGGGRVLVGLCEFDLETRQARNRRAFPPRESRGWATGSNLREVRR